MVPFIEVIHSSPLLLPGGSNELNLLNFIEKKNDKVSSENRVYSLL